MYPGVGKSGSPAPKPMTGLPAAFSALALASTASVADSEIAETRAETLLDMCFILPPADPTSCCIFPQPPRCPWRTWRFDGRAVQTYTAWTDIGPVAAAACPRVVLGGLLKQRGE